MGFVKTEKFYDKVLERTCGILAQERVMTAKDIAKELEYDSGKYNVTARSLSQIIRAYSGNLIEFIDRNGEPGFYYLNEAIFNEENTYT